MKQQMLLWESPGIRAARARGENVGRPDEGVPILGMTQQNLDWMLAPRQPPPLPWRSAGTG